MSLKPAGTRQQAFTTCTLKDLCPEDKQKVAQLVKQVVELGKENQQLKVAATTAASAEEKLRQIQDCNKEAVKENCSLKSKLGQAITVLRMYHHKVQGLDAALRALQHSATADAPADTQQQQDEAQGAQQQEQQPQQQQDEATDPLALSAPAPASTAAAAGSSSCGPQQQQTSEPSSQGIQQPAVQQCLCSKLLCGGLSAGPVVLPGSSLAVSLPLQQLAALQLQDSSLFAEQLVSQPRTVLQFDASLGTQGAYVLRELPQQPQQLQVLGGRAPAGTPSATGSPAAATVLQLPAQQQLSPQPQQQEQGQGPQRMSAGGAATAAAAAAASSALAAVKAAAAACAATPWQPGLSSCSSSSPHHLQQLQAPAGDAFTRLSDPAQHLAAHGTAACAQAAGGAAGGDSAAGDCSQLSQQAGAGPGGLWAVEEVPLLDVASAPVHVLVQNEKSASSLHQACARVTLAGGMADGTASPLPPSPPAAAAVYAAGGGGVPGPALSCSGQEMPELWPTGPQQFDAPLGHDPVPACQQGRAQQVQQWVTQHQQQQQEGGQQLMQPPSLQQCSSALQRSYMASSASPASADQQQSGQQAHAWGQPHSQRAAAAAGHPHANAGQGPIASHWQQQQQQQQWFEQQQPEPGPLAHGVDEASSRALLQKFDASLVDILAEVERLEQQQAAARHQLHQQGHQQQQQQQRRRQHRPAAQQQVQQQHAVAGDGGQGWQQDQGLAAAGSLAAASCKPSRHELLHQKHAQLQQRMMQLQQEEAGSQHSSGLYSAGRKLAGQQQVLSAGGWGYGSAAEYDADDVSDILNHLD